MFKHILQYPTFPAMAVAACFLLVTSCAGRNAPAGSAQPASGYITTPDSAELYYRVVGDGPQTVVIPGDFLLYEDFHHLSKGRTLIFYDMRNRGRSRPVYDSGRIGISYDIADLETVRSHFGIDKMQLVGYSYLGKMVAMYALRHPGHVDRIVQMGPVPMTFGTQYPDSLTANDPQPVVDERALVSVREMREQNRHLTHPREYCEEEYRVTGIRLIGDPRNSDMLGPSDCHLPNEWPVNLARHFTAHFVSMQQASLTRGDLQPLHHPVFTIHGTRDRNAPYGSGREWVRHLPDARLLTVEGAAHRAWVEFPQTVYGAVDTFLSGEWPDGSATLSPSGG